MGTIKKIKLIVTDFIRYIYQETHYYTPSLQRYIIMGKPSNEEEVRKDPIKKPLNSFMLYSRAERKKISDANPKLHNAEISKRLGASWKALSDKDRKAFTEEAKRLRQIYLA